ncbi:ABC transporter ATP-binding protein [Noviherbaspirillum denitrificans]|uniref:ABC transporter ATP-binding protein n=1 Tax=Noviherbaspirillum denitrificans TaxID=1968433 RepID=A0A254T7U1_9BURK|nr:ABC transporter ATP-binding protein [Noviherbaspirillum denitrificans]OWW18716.1 ABC transporter ATP-binding protein [Noviherbaspirillum denitrificans]
MSANTLQIRNLTRAFGGLVAVDDVSFDVAPRRITTVIGPNGAGKSTLFNLISGALLPDSGSVRLGALDVTAMPPQRRQRAGIARSFQITNLFFGLTVGENLRLAAQALESRRHMVLPVGRSRRALAKVDEIIYRFGLGEKVRELAGNLSHGEQRRLEIAMCLACEPQVLMMDEPTQGMSHHDTQDTAELVRSLARDVTVMLVEHDIGLVMDLSDHVVVMHQGRKLADGAPREVRDNPAVQAAYFGNH